jgi:hypothetical protein
MVFAFDDCTADCAHQMCKTRGFASVIRRDVRSIFKRAPRTISFEAKIVDREMNRSLKLDEMVEPRRNRLRRVFADELIHYDLTVGDESHLAIFHGDHTPGSFGEVMGVPYRRWSRFIVP